MLQNEQQSEDGVEYSRISEDGSIGDEQQAKLNGDSRKDEES